MKLLIILSLLFTLPTFANTDDLLDSLQITEHQLDSIQTEIYDKTDDYMKDAKKPSPLLLGLTSAVCATIFVAAIRHGGSDSYATGFWGLCTAATGAGAIFNPLALKKQEKEIRRLHKDQLTLITKKEQLVEKIKEKAQYESEEVQERIAEVLESLEQNEDD